MQQAQPLVEAVGALPRLHVLCFGDKTRQDGRGEPGFERLGLEPRVDEAAAWKSGRNGKR